MNKLKRMILKRKYLTKDDSEKEQTEQGQFWKRKI